MGKVWIWGVLGVLLALVFVAGYGQVKEVLKPPILPEPLISFMVDLRTGEIIQPKSTMVPVPCTMMVQIIQFQPPWLIMKVTLSSKDCCLKVEVPHTAPSGYWLHIGNSPGNDGGGGDYGQFSNDSELTIVGQMLEIYGNDYQIRECPACPRPFIKATGFAALGPGKILAWLTDGCVVIKEVANGNVVTLTNAYIFRLGGPDAEAGTNDLAYWFGFNHVVNTAQCPRSGTGTGTPISFEVLQGRCAECPKCDVQSVSPFTFR